MFHSLEFRNKISHLTLSHFKTLPKTGKPNADEWTVLASIVKFDATHLELVALGTGSKCIGASKMSKCGDILNDSHAEIICRRAFLRYLYFHINLALKNDKNSIFRLNDESNKFVLNGNLSFHLFTTHVPCGDAAIFPKQNLEDFGDIINQNDDNKEFSTVLNTNLEKHVKTDSIQTLESNFSKAPHIIKMSNIDNNSENESQTTGINLLKQESKRKKAFLKSVDQTLESFPKKAKLDLDMFRTGAKCLRSDAKQDSKASGVQYHTLGAIRTKPGRGDPTKSVSCSDKLAKWSFMGIQGALLSLLLDQPIFLTSLTIIGGTPYSEESLNRALKTRFNVSLPLLHKSKFLIVGQANLTFEFAKCDSKRPCPSSIIWCKTTNRQLEVSVDGKKQGATKKLENKKGGRLLISKKELFNTFADIVTKNTILTMTDFSKLSYSESKNKAQLYQTHWKFVKEEIFMIWTKKDDNLLNFYPDV